MRYTDVEDGIFALYKKIQFYRFLITVGLTLTVLSVFSGLAATAMLFSGAFDLSSQIQNIQSFDQLTPEVWGQLQILAEREQILTYGVIFTGLLTFVVGILIPSLVITKLVRTLKKLENQLRDTIREAVHDFTHTIQEYGSEPFVNANYWVEVVLIVLQYFARSSRHPSLLLAVDLVDLTRLEMAIARQKQAEAKPEGSPES